MNTELMTMPGMPLLDISNQATSGNTRPASWYLEWATGGGSSDSGVSVSGYTALTHCPLWQGVNIIAGDIGQVPIRLVKNDFDDQKKHPAWNLLRVRPNALQTPSVFKETVMQWALIWGNAVCWIVRRGSRPVELIPLRPDFLWPMLLNFDDRQEVYYHYTSPTTGQEYVFSSDDVLHIQGLTSDGIWGYPLHQIAKNTIGHGLALERHGNRSFSNGARPSGVLKHPGKLPQEARALLREDWERLHSGVDNSGRIAVLYEGMEFQAMSMSNIDAQWIEAKKLDRQMAASLLNLPAHKLNSLEDASVRSNLEEQNADYVQRTLTRWFNRMSEEFAHKLLRVDEWQSDEYRFVWDTIEFMLGDVETTMLIAEKGVMSALLSPNEARRIYLKLPPYEGGDVYGSPAINPREPVAETDDAEEPEETPEPPPVAENSRVAHEKLLLDRLEHVIRREHVALADAAKGAANFVNWLDAYYLPSEGAASKMSHLAMAAADPAVAACESIGIPAATIYTELAAYCRKRHSLLLKTAEVATQEQLPECVRLTVTTDPRTVASGLLRAALYGERYEES